MNSSMNPSLRAALLQDTDLRLQAANLASQSAARFVSLVTCKTHEHCDESCTGRPTVFPPQIIGESKLRFNAPSGPKSKFPLIQENPIPIPADVFRYSSIDSAAGEIRVFRVKQAVFRTDPVELELVTINISSEDIPEYAALSYCWGDPTFDHVVICNGQSLKVNASLHNCLKRHRADVVAKPDLLWADAISINQRDKDEVNQQLVLMGDIYQEANVVYLDFGDVDISWYLAYDLMVRVKFIYQLYEDVLPDDMADFLQRNGLPEADSMAWRAYFHILLSPWCNRSWTVQEMVLARDNRCRYGRFTFEWKELIHTFELAQFCGAVTSLLTRRTAEREQFLTGWGNFSRNLRIRVEYQMQRLTPLQALWRTRDCQVSNPRDKLVAMLGIISNQMKQVKLPVFKADYTWSIEELFHNFAVFMLKNFPPPERAAVLSYAGLHRRNKERNMPSWVPDWLHQPSSPTVLAILRETRFNAAKGTRPAIFVFGDYETGNSCITQVSMVLGKITELGASCDMGGHDRQSKISKKDVEMSMKNPMMRGEIIWQYWQQEVWQMYSRWAEKSNTRYPDAKEAFALTLLGGDTYTGNMATKNSCPIEKPYEALTGAIYDIHAGIPSIEGDNVPATESKMFRRQAPFVCFGRRFAFTDTGYVGLVPMCTQIGDEVRILSGVDVPFVLRRIDPEKASYQLVGDAYIQGVMEGEAMEGVQMSDWGPILLY